MSKASKAAEEYFRGGNPYCEHVEEDRKKEGFIEGYEQAEEDIISLIESRIGEILGDAQPAPVLRAELRELINKIEEK